MENKIEIISEIEKCIGKWQGVEWCYPISRRVWVDEWETYIEIEFDCDGYTSAISADDIEESLLEEYAVHSEYDAVREAIRDIASHAEKYINSAVENAQQCDVLGNEAIEFIKNGDYDAAKECVEEACGLEFEFGDCPTWQPAIFWED